MKRIIYLVLCLLVVFSLVSCSSQIQSHDMNNVKSETAYSYVADDAIAFEPIIEEKVYAESESYEEPKVFDAPSENMSDSITDGRKIIYSASFSIQSKEYDKSVFALKSLCEEYGAWFESSNSYGTAEAGNRSSHYTIRIPVNNYKAFISKQDTIGIVTSSSENNRDVTEQYTDIEARLASATLREERVLKILENAAMLDDVLALERELSDIRYEIESMTGSLRKYDSLVSYSTVNVNIDEVTVYQPKQPAPLTFAERLSKGFKGGIDNFVKGFQNLVVTITYNLIGFVFWTLVIVIVVIVVCHKISKKKKANKEKEENKE